MLTRALARASRRLIFVWTLPSVGPNRYTCTVLYRVLVGSVTYDVNKPVGQIGTVGSSLFWNIIFLFTSNLISVGWLPYNWGD